MKRLFLTVVLAAAGWCAYAQNYMMKKRLELIQPIQKKVFDAINAYAQSHGYDLVLDSASNPTLLYNAPKLDQTEGVIKSLK